MESNDKSNTQDIKYFMVSGKGAPIEKSLCIDSDELQKTVLLQIYYCDMLKIKARTGDIVLAVRKWIYSKCYQAENVVTKNWIDIPDFEVYRLLAQMYAKDLIDSIEQNDGSYFVLKELGTNLCKDYVMQK